MTYSIVARDPASGQLGVAVQSHWFSVGSLVGWARPGVGAVATQANVRVDYGPRGLDLMGGGASAAEALGALSAGDEGRASRQVAMVDAGGAVAALTGSGCMAFAGDVQGDEVSCQANIMVSSDVWTAMLDAYMWSSGELCDRLMAALAAGQEAGGDLRGVQSAALLVVPRAGEPWETVVSLRVEDSDDPLGELARLLRLSRAYAAAAEGDALMASSGAAAAAAAYARAMELAPESEELRFWAAVSAGSSVDHLAPRWRELQRRLG